MKPLCTNYPEVYSVLWESSQDPAWDESVEAARNLCGTCLLNTPEIARPCLGMNRRERWVKAIRGLPLHDEPVPAVRSIHKKADDGKRLAVIRELIAEGATVNDALERFGITRSALKKWCDNRGYQAEWKALVNRHGTARLEELTHLISVGAGLGEVLERLDVTREALWKWCNDKGCLDLYKQLSPPKVEMISLRRRPRKDAA